RAAVRPDGGDRRGARGAAPAPQPDGPGRVPERASGIVIAARDRAAGHRQGPGGPRRVDGGLIGRVMKAFLPLLLVVLAPAAFGLTIEYGERPEPLAECDRLAYRGERSAASTCYQRLRAGDDLAIRAEAAR